MKSVTEQVLAKTEEYCADCGIGAGTADVIEYRAQLYFVAHLLHFLSFFFPTASVKVFMHGRRKSSSADTVRSCI